MELYAKDLYGASCLSAVFPRRVSLRTGEIPQAVRFETGGIGALEFDVSEIVPSSDEIAHELSAAGEEGLAVSIKQPRVSAPEEENETFGVVVKS
jgi:hypothetical protein